MTAGGSGTNNIAIGYNAGSSSSPLAITTQSNRIVLGNNDVTNIYQKVASTVTSDARDKTDIMDLDCDCWGLDYIDRLNPVNV